MKRTLCLLVAWFFTTSMGFSAGLIIVHDDEFWRRPPTSLPPRPHPPRPFVPPVWAALETTFTKADIRVRDQFATTQVEQEFYNPNARQLEGTFLFPVPKGAHISKFTMEINGKPMEAELVAADKARGIYEDIVRKLRDPALLEYAGRDLFKVRIFPIEANSRKRITLSWSQLLKSDGGLVSFVLPLNTEKFSAAPIKTVSVKLDVETTRPLKSIYSPSHKLEIKRHGANKATLGYEATDVKPDTDLQLFFAQEASDVGVSLLTYKNPGEDGYFLLLASPGMDTKQAKVIPKDVTFVLDTSGSMAGAKLDQAKKALAFCVENLNEADRFEILRFATEVEPLFDKLEGVSRDSRGRAQSFIKDLKPTGGTAIDEALRKALSMRPEKGERPYVVIFLTDGRPTVGTTSEDQIVDNAKKQSAGNVRVFCFGIGTDVNTHMLDKITEETRAYSQYVLPEEDIEVKVSSFFTKVKDPVLASPTITFPGAVRATKLYPSPVPDLFKGEQVVLVGRYSGQGDGAVQMQGTVSGETRKFAWDTKFPETGSDHEFIPRLWATRRVGYLLDEIRLRGESKELKDEVVELARKYSIVTPFTAYLSVEDEARRGIVSNARTLPLGEGFVEQERFSRRLRAEKDGASAVAGARSYSALKEANAPADAIQRGSTEAFRVATERERSATLATTPAPMSTAPSGRTGLGAPVTVAKPAAPATLARDYYQQSQYVGGKAFFRTENRWLDADVQKLSGAKRIKIQFGSPEYFELIKTHAKVVPWLALGNNVEFAVDGTIYEITEQ